MGRDRFRRLCPVPPLLISGNRHLYDRHALDAWLDRLSGLSRPSEGDFVEKLGSG